MKSLLTTIISFHLTLTAFTQGTLLWKNSTSPRAAIYEMDGVTPLEGSTYLVDLFYAAVGANPPTFTSLGLATPFGTGAAAGYFNAGVVAIPGFAPGSQVQIQARAWRASDGPTWFSAATRGPYARVSGGSGQPIPTITVTLGGGGSPPSLPTSFDGYLLSHSISSFCLCSEPSTIPEPSTLLLGASGLAGLVLLRHRRKA